MLNEQLMRTNSEYHAQKNSLHEKLVRTVEDQFDQLGFSPLDPRLKEAFQVIPRHKHIDLNYILHYFDSGELLSEVYSDRIFGLDVDVFHKLLGKKLWEKGIDMSELSMQELKQVFAYYEVSLLSTASAPTIVGLMTQAVLPFRFREGKEYSALDIGAGLLYQSAVLAKVGFEVDAIEIKPHLVERAKEIVEEEGYWKIGVTQGDGRLGSTSGKLYDAIIVAAAVGEQEVIERLKSQLKIGGRLVLPEVTGEFRNQGFDLRGVSFESADYSQTLRVYERINNETFECSEVTSVPVSFVKLQDWDFDDEI